MVTWWGYKHQFCTICIFLEKLSGICPEFFLVFWNFSCPEFVQFYLSGICPEFFHVWNMSSFICPEFVQNFFMSRICLEKISGIFHVQNLSSLFVQILSRFFVCPEYVQKIFLGFFLCPEFVWFFGHEKILNINSDHFSGHFPDMENEFRTISLTFSGHFFFIGPSSHILPKWFSVSTKFLIEHYQADYMANRAKNINSGIYLSIPYTHSAARSNQFFHN